MKKFNRIALISIIFLSLVLALTGCGGGNGGGNGGEPPKLSYNLTVNALGNGSVGQAVKVAASSVHTEGDLVELTASPDSSWSFCYWQGDVAASDAPNPVITIAVDRDKTVTAVFVRGLQLASNGKAYSYDTIWNDPFIYPDQFNQDGFGTGFPWDGFGRGVFCILNPLVAVLPSEPGLMTNSQIQVWIIKASDFTIGPDGRCNLQGKDVSDFLGGPDLVYVQKTASSGAGAILVWQAPLLDRRTGAASITEGEQFVLIIETPDSAGNFDNIFDINTDYVDGAREAGDNGPRGFSVVNVTP